MKKTFLHFIFINLLIISVLNIQACRNTEETVSCFPTVPVVVNLNLNLPAYSSLNYVGQAMYIDEQQAGTRGLIVVRTADNPAVFKVYDRNAPHLCPDNNTTLVVKDNISIVCPKDNATWILISGQPTAVTGIPPKTYFYNYDAATKNLSIYN